MLAYPAPAMIFYNMWPPQLQADKLSIRQQLLPLARLKRSRSQKNNFRVTFVARHSIAKEAYRGTKVFILPATTNTPVTYATNLSRRNTIWECTSPSSTRFPSLTVKFAGKYLKIKRPWQDMKQLMLANLNTLVMCATKPFHLSTTWRFTNLSTTSSTSVTCAQKHFLRRPNWPIT